MSMLSGMPINATSPCGTLVGTWLAIALAPLYRHKRDDFFRWFLRLGERGLQPVDDGDAEFARQFHQPREQRLIVASRKGYRDCLVRHLAPRYNEAGPESAGTLV